MNTKRKTISALILAAFAASPLLAQNAPATRPAAAPPYPTEGTVVPEAPYLQHDRHLHAVNPKHPTTQSTARFVTNRPGALQLTLPEEKDAFSFVVYGDRTGGPALGVNVLADAVRDTNLLEPDLVFTVGDLVQGYNEAPEWRVQAREYKAIMDKLLCPWFPVAGNHDVYWRDKDRSGDKKPVGENEKEYETFFGPLWYAVKHKNCWFIALYSDEGNPETGEKNFSKPEANVMSEAQFSWLKETLAKAKGADHVFLFLHHPRWLGSFDHGGYGNSWDRVHKALVEAGNVTAVFGGHIHYMRYDPKDGIEYVTLATVGGGQDGASPQAGYLHQYHVVTVRKNQVAMTAYPVGSALNVRELTGDVVEENVKLAKVPITFNKAVGLKADGTVDELVKVKLRNPTSRAVEFTVMPESKDSRWVTSPDHQHKVVEPGSEMEVPFRVRRIGSPIDETLRLLEVVVDADYLAPSKRYAAPTRREVVPMDVSAVPTSGNHALDIIKDETGVSIPANVLKLPGKEFTLEAKFNARSFKERNGLMTRMQSSNYGIFVSGGRPSCNVWLGDSYLVASAPRGFKLDTNRWYDIAMVFDGTELRLYLDGKLIGKNRREGAEFKENKLPLIIGGDVGGSGEAMDSLDGRIDVVRFSSTARYTGDGYRIQDKFKADSKTMLLLNMDHAFGHWIVDEATVGRFYEIPGGAKLSPVETP